MEKQLLEIQLVKLSQARQALALASSLEELKQIKDVAKAAKAYAQAKHWGNEMKNEAAEIEIRAMREMGKIIEEQQREGKLATQKTGVVSKDTSKLSDIGITRDESSQSKKISTINSIEFEKFIKEGKESGELSKTSILSDLKKEKRAIEIEKIKENITKENLVINDSFDVVCIDPPWAYEERSGVSSDGYSPNNNRGITPYPTMSVSEISKIELPLKENAVVYLWTTHAFLRDSFDLLETWGLNYKATIVWDKESLGIGRNIRMQCEFCLLATKGKPILNGSSERDIIREQRREHSRKPEGFYEKVEKMTFGSKLDYFAREQRNGWETHGIEKNKFVS